MKSGGGGEVAIRVMMIQENAENRRQKNSGCVFSQAGARVGSGALGWLLDGLPAYSYDGRSGRAFSGDSTITDST